tara:strand:- start:222 stop:470 length:249 start_codon:yes stop_codon:yes gene_type:complete
MSLPENTIEITEKELDVLAKALLETQMVQEVDDRILVSVSQALNLIALLLFRMRQECKVPYAEALLHEFKQDIQEQEKEEGR